MQIIPLDSVPVVEREHIREGRFRIQYILNGEEGSPGNFALMLSDLPDGYASPRHRHNFDQIRYQLTGSFDFASDGQMGPGDIGYFPEGTRYGPQTSDEPNRTLVLQFGGASGSGYLSPDQYNAAMEALKQRGRFAEGIYTVDKPGGGVVNKDAFEAVWEEVSGRPLAYPAPRYTSPILIHPDNFDWVSRSDKPGVASKRLGQFSERGTALELFAVDANARLSLAPGVIYFMISGDARVEEEPVTAGTTVFDADQPAALLATTACELLAITLPRFD